MMPFLMLEPLPDWMHDTELVHAALLLPVLLVSGPALFRGGSIDHRIWAFGAMAFALLCAALLMHSEQLEKLVSVFGAVLLVIAHLLNMRKRGV